MHTLPPLIVFQKMILYHKTLFENIAGLIRTFAISLILDNECLSECLEEIAAPALGITVASLPDRRESVFFYATL
jgi:hypothetical protein